MPSVSQPISTRRVAPSWRRWIAHPYQEKAVGHLCRRGSAALFLDPGLGKTAITLDAFCKLQAAGVAKQMLVIAPLRVCQTVWWQEAQKWEQFRHLRFSLLHGSKKAERLRDDADVWLINPEGTAWLAEQFKFRGLPWDTVVIDELTKFKNHQSERSKALRPRLKQVARRWGLTGSPAPNGLMDLFGQMLVLDDGAALGRFITHYRDQYFQLDYDGFTYTPMPGAQKRIEECIRPYVLTMSADDYLTLPPLIDDVRVLEMEPKARATYSRMKKDMLAELPEGVVTGANAAAVYSKLKQMANGAVYVGEDKSNVSTLHSTKLEAVDDLLEELAGQQLLLAYEFNHDAARLKRHFGERITFLASGSSEARSREIVDAWNAGKIRFLACHPASAAHGLNLQQSACAHVAWLSPTWDLELYMQFIRRVRRQGSEAQRIFNHLFVMRDSIDELALQALQDKDTTQTRLLKGLNSILRDAEPYAAGQAGEGETKVVAKLSRQSDAASGERPLPPGWGKPAVTNGVGAPPQTQAAPERVIPKGWGAPILAAVDNGQRARIEEKLTGGHDLRTAEVAHPESVPDARSAFSRGVQEAAVALADQGIPMTLGADVKAALEVRGETVREAPITSDTPSPRRRRKATEPASNDEVTPQIRLGILQLAFASSETTLEDGMEIAKEFLDFVNGE